MAPQFTDEMERPAQAGIVISAAPFTHPSWALTIPPFLCPDLQSRRTLVPRHRQESSLFFPLPSFLGQWPRQDPIFWKIKEGEKVGGCGLSLGGRRRSSSCISRESGMRCSRKALCDPGCDGRINMNTSAHSWPFCTNERVLFLSSAYLSFPNLEWLADGCAYHNQMSLDLVVGFV